MSNLGVDRVREDLAIIRQALGKQLSTLLFGAIMPLGSYQTAGIFAGCWLLLGGLSTAGIMAWQLRKDCAHGND